MQVQLQGPYIMCRPSAASDVIGLWFYKEDEHATISRLIQDLVQVRMCSLTRMYSLTTRKMNTQPSVD
jgi:hypothetical protein